MYCRLGKATAKKILGSDDCNNSKRAGLSSKSVRHPSKQVNYLSKIA